MLGLSELRQTKVYQEAEQEGGLNAKLAAVPRFLTLGLPAEQIASALDLPVEEVQRIEQNLSDEMKASD